MSVTFALGMLCGLVIGSWLSYLAFTWVHPEASEPIEDPVPPFLRCPPCTEDCRQGEDCPARKNKNIEE